MSMQDPEFEFHKGIEVGDIITAYSAGWHRVVDIEERYYGVGTASNMRPPQGKQRGDRLGNFITTVKVMQANGKPIEGRAESKCDASWCRKLTPEYIAELRAKDNQKWEALLAMVRQ